MTEFSPQEPAPLNDTPEAKGLRHDAHIDRVEALEREALARGLSSEEAKALAWAQVEGSQAQGEAASEGSRSDGRHPHPHPHDISLGG